jgi:hypothetical protein
MDIACHVTASNKLEKRQCECIAHRIDVKIYNKDTMRQLLSNIWMCIEFDCPQQFTVKGIV